MITRVGSPDALLRTTTYKIISNVENDQQNTPNMLAVSRARQPAGEERMEEEEEEEEEIQDVVRHILLYNEKCQRSAASCLPTTTQTPAAYSCKTACSPAENVPPAWWPLPGWRGRACVRAVRWGFWLVFGGSCLPLYPVQSFAFCKRASEVTTWMWKPVVQLLHDGSQRQVSGNVTCYKAYGLVLSFTVVKAYPMWAFKVNTHTHTHTRTHTQEWV